MKLRSKLLSLILLSVIPLFGCSDPKEKQLIELTQSKNYSQLMSLFNDELTNGNTRVLKRPIDGNAEPSDSTIFVRAALTLLSSSTYSASNTGVLLLNNKNSVESYFFLVQEVIDLSIKNGTKTPDHLDSFLYEVYTEQYHELDDNYKSKLDQLIRSDSVYIERIKTSILREINTSKDLEVLLSLLNLAKIEISNELFMQIENLEKELAGAQESRSSSSSRIASLNSRISRLESKYGEDVIQYSKSSYLFRGYMIAQLDQIGGTTFYEVRDMSSKTYLLATTETKFGSRGFFSLRVADSYGVNMKTTAAYGGFDTTVPLIGEIPEEWYNKYLLYTQEVMPLEDTLRSLLRGNRNDNTIDELERRISAKRNELFTLIKQNIDL